VALARVPDLHIVTIFWRERGLKPRDYMPFVWFVLIREKCGLAKSYFFSMDVQFSTIL
jgi:hypothetical protein